MSSLILIQEADRLAQVQAQLLDSLGTVESQEGELGDQDKSRKQLGEKSLGNPPDAPRNTHRVRGKESHNPFPPGV